jgi:hypothetical protein
VPVCLEWLWQGGRNDATLRSDLCRFHDAGDQPADYPGDGNEIWSLEELSLTDPRITVHDSYHVEIDLSDDPLELQGGHTYWFSFFPTGSWNENDAWGWRAAHSSIAHGMPAQVAPGPGWGGSGEWMPGQGVYPMEEFRDWAFALYSGDCDPLATETDCGDALDDDEDGLTDCADPDCEYSPNCLPPCATSGTLAIGGQMSGDTENSWATHLYDDYPGCGAFFETGPELIFEFCPDEDATIDVILTCLNGGDGVPDLDVMVLQDSGCQCCSPLDCVAKGYVADNPEVISALEVVAGQLYYLVVDGYNGQSGQFTLELQPS